MNSIFKLHTETVKPSVILVVSLLLAICVQASGDDNMIVLKTVNKRYVKGKPYCIDNIDKELFIWVNTLAASNQVIALQRPVDKSILMRFPLKDLTQSSRTLLNNMNIKTRNAGQPTIRTGILDIPDRSFNPLKGNSIEKRVASFVNRISKRIRKVQIEAHNKGLLLPPQKTISSLEQVQHSRYLNGSMNKFDMNKYERKIENALSSYESSLNIVNQAYNRMRQLEWKAGATKEQLIQQAYNNGRESGLMEGKRRGRREGRKAGYQEGYEEGSYEGKHREREEWQRGTGKQEPWW